MSNDYNFAYLDEQTKRMIFIGKLHIVKHVAQLERL